MAAPAPSQQDVGRTLRRARQRHRVQLEEAADTTRIPKRYLEALESNAPLDAYPAPVYARAFLREYATYLRIDPEPLIARFGAFAPEEVHLMSMGEALAPPRRWPGRVLLALSIAALVGLAAVGVMSARNNARGLGNVPHHARTAPASHAPTGPRSPAPPARTYSGISAVVSVLDRCWIAVVADGTPVVQRVFDPSQGHTFAARHSLDLTLGNAGGVRLVLNGKHIPTGNPGQVLHLGVVFDHGTIHVTRA